MRCRWGFSPACARASASGPRRAPAVSRARGATPSSARVEPPLDADLAALGRCLSSCSRRPRARPAVAGHRSLTRGRAALTVTWDCGYASPTARGCSTRPRRSPRCSSGCSAGPSCRTSTDPRWRLVSGGRTAFREPRARSRARPALLPRLARGRSLLGVRARHPDGPHPDLSRLHRRHARASSSRGAPHGELARSLPRRARVAPLLLGVINETKAALAGRTGPPLLPGLLRSRASSSGRDSSSAGRRPGSSSRGRSCASWRRSSPRSCSPSAGQPASLSFSGDMILFVYVFALARFFVAAAAHGHGLGVRGHGGRARGDLLGAGRAGALLRNARSHAALRLAVAVGHARRRRRGGRGRRRARRSSSSSRAGSSSSSRRTRGSRSTTRTPTSS